MEYRDVQVEITMSKHPDSSYAIDFLSQIVFGQLQRAMADKEKATDKLDRANSTLQNVSTELATHGLVRSDVEQEIARLEKIVGDKLDARR